MNQPAPFDPTYPDSFHCSHGRDVREHREGERRVGNARGSTAREQGSREGKRRAETISETVRDDLRDDQRRSQRRCQI